MKLVLDTNVILDLLFWHDPRCDALAAALAAGRVRCFTDAACLAELERVLAYPQFALDAAAQQALLARYRELAESVAESMAESMAESVPESAPPVADAAVEPSPAELPRCRDADDQKFMELAARCAADLLLTRDRELLRLAHSRRRPPPFAILVPERAAERFAAAPATDQEAA